MVAGLVTQELGGVGGGRRAGRLEPAVETGAGPERAACQTASLQLLLWTLKGSESGARGSELCLRLTLMTIWFVKVHVTSPKCQSSGGVDTGMKGRKEHGDRVIRAGFTEDVAGQQDSRAVR